MLQASTDDAYRGRVMSVWAIQFIGLMPIGQLALGSIGAVLGIHTALIVGGAISVAAGVYGLLRVPALLEWRAPAHRHIAAEPIAAESLGAVTPTVTLGDASTLK